MTFRQLALKNIQGNWHRYIAFFLSSTFSVMIFYIYASFIFHPDVVNGTIQAAAKVRQGMVACEFLIVIFSFFFVLYASFAFLKTRKKEIGLLTLFGMTRSQINKLVLYENAAIAVLSIVVGCSLGTLFSKLFFMALAELLQVDNPIRFLIVPQALLYTGVGFLVLFLAITLITLVGMSRNQVIELLKASKKPKTMPASSRWLVLLAAACLIAGYSVAYTATPNNLVIVMMPVVFLTVVGTYFLFTQASVAILKRLQRMPQIYYRNTQFITISQLVFKMKDNARILFTVSILSAVILSASGSVYMFYQGARGQIMDHFPQSISFVAKGSTVPPSLQPDQVKSVMTRHGIQITDQIQAVGIQSSIQIKAYNNRKTDVLLLPASVYNGLASQGQSRSGKKPSIAIEPGHAVIVNPYSESEVTLFGKGDLMTTTAGSELTLRMDGQLDGAILNPIYEATYIVLLNDNQFKTLLGTMPEEQKVAYIGYELKDWEKADEAIKQLEGDLPSDQKSRFSNRTESFLSMKQFSSLTLFIGMFVSILFFMASGSMLYFKLFTELQEDQAQYKALTRIGVSMQEIRKITNTQIGIIFFIPVIIGSVHAGFAYKALSNLVSISVWKYGVTIMLIYAVMQLFYFLLTRRAYMKQMKHL
ncbi:ABC transporter permease [Paenibacillus sp. RC67]|uniref:ABC transporter permease n=1 Tax=Paenibacillus sp. RC67 TaxID=3039392 RepID=UPI0024AD2D2F|nr:ABC transporter permease [Paenibacillus sp. RC67]